MAERQQRFQQGTQQGQQQQQARGDPPKGPYKGPNNRQYPQRLPINDGKAHAYLADVTDEGYAIYKTEQEQEQEQYR